MKHKIGWKELECMGASERVMEFYYSTDPLTIVYEKGRFEVTGAYEFLADDEQELLAHLEACAEPMEEEEHE